MNATTNTAPVTDTKKKTPKLVCNITGQSRVTTSDYIALRIKALNITGQEYLELYVCKDAMKLLRQGKTPAEIQEVLKVDKALRLPISAEEVARMLVINGKQKGGAAGPALSPRAQRALEQTKLATVAGKGAVKQPAHAGK